MLHSAKRKVQLESVCLTVLVNHAGTPVERAPHPPLCQLQGRGGLLKQLTLAKRMTKRKCSVLSPSSLLSHLEVIVAKRKWRLFTSLVSLSPFRRMGGIPAVNGKGERLLLHVGIIDILQSYR